MAEEIIKTKVIFELLRQSTSLPVVSAFLKAKGLTHSAGSWEEMFEKRISPAIAAFEISNDDLVALLRSVEECGRQHIFLFTCPSAKAVELINRGRITSILNSRGLSEILSQPKVLEKAEEAQLVDVRWESATIDLNLTIKEYELRKYTTFIGTQQYGNEIHKIYGLAEQRAVNVAKLHRDGLLEIRLTSLSNTTKYEDEIRRFWHNIGHLLPGSEFSELSLSTAKDRLWIERTSLQDLIRYSDSTIRDEAGNVLRAATGNDEADLNANSAVGQSLDYLLQTDKNSYCASANLWFKKTSELSADCHVLLNGESNEFALPANCSEEDYKYVLSQLRYFIQRVS